MTSLLSSVVSAYAEPTWSVETHNEKYLNREDDILIKFPSMVLLNNIRTPGKKIFLYRPLCQHLYKIKNVSSDWFRMRCDQIIDHISTHGTSNHIKEYNWSPNTDLELIAYHWITCVLEIKSHRDVLWIKANDLFSNKTHTIDQVTSHLNLDKVQNYNFASIDVKRIKVNGTNRECDILDYPKDHHTIVNDKHGIIETSTALDDPEVLSITEHIETTFPELNMYIRS